MLDEASRGDGPVLGGFAVLARVDHHVKEGGAVAGLGVQAEGVPLLFEVEGNADLVVLELPDLVVFGVAIPEDDRGALMFQYHKKKQGEENRVLEWGHE